MHHLALEIQHHAFLALIVMVGVALILCRAMTSATRRADRTRRREAGARTERLLRDQRESLSAANAKLGKLKASGVWRDDPQAYRYARRETEADVSILGANVRDLQRSRDWQTRPWWRWSR